MVNSPLGKPWLLYVLLGTSLALNLVMVLDRPAREATAGGGEEVEATAAPATEVVAATVDGAPAAPAAPAVPLPEGWQISKADVEHSLARTLQNAAGEKGDALAAAYARLFVWELDLRRDLQKGDQVEVIWRTHPESVVEVLAARYHSRKLGKTIEAWKWQAPGEPFAVFWDSNGRGIERRLVDGPIVRYEQITALLKDRPSHKGMDFKAPVGTEVVAPGAGVVTRSNWNWTANGNCLELQLDDGHLVKLLHLAENKVEPGTRFTKGQVLALSGNTGRSTAPHLHYELHKGDKVVDPLEYHKLEQQQLTGATLEAFQVEKARLAAMLDGSLALR